MLLEFAIFFKYQHISSVSLAPILYRKLYTKILIQKYLSALYIFTYSFITNYSQGVQRMFQPLWIVLLIRCPL